MPNNNIHVVPISQSEYTTLCSSGEVDNNTYYTIVNNTGINSDVICGTKTYTCYDDPYKKISALEDEVRMLKESITDLLNNQKFDD